MELFAAAGMELPLGGGSTRRSPLTLRSLRVPLFNYKIVQQARELAAFNPSDEQVAAAADYAKKVKSPKFLKQKETAIRPVFIAQVLQTILGYQTFDAENTYSLAFEEPIRRGAVDVAIGRFGQPDGKRDIVAPFELKGPDTSDLDKIMPGRGRSPVQQAWDYAIDAPGSRWVLVSNCVEIRLYGFGRGREAYETFDLSKLDDREEHARLWLILSAARLLGDGTDKLLRDTDSAYKDVTNDLYKDYKDLRDRLIQFLIDASDGPRLKPLAAIEVAQKTLDRILFIAFAERTDLLPDKLLERAAKADNEFVPQPIWLNFLALFRYVDTGHHGRNDFYIPAYNGGLFARDAVADALILPDELAKSVASLGQWDYRREVPVTVLGHMFEQSITDIEKLKAESRGEPVPDVTKRKREGVVYTPDFVTRFLTERTIGLTLREARASLRAQAGLQPEGEDGPEPQPEQELAYLQAYLAKLRSLTIVDPACGSGAFLIAAFDMLAPEYQRVTARLADLGENIDFDIFDEIVTKNLYGVDLNAESVEITRLSLWLKTARRNHKLQNLEATIKTGNSLIADPAFTDRPFDWHAAFAQVFAQNKPEEERGFDIVLGNPPYVRMEFIKPFKPYLEKHYVVAADRADLYAYFFEKGAALLKHGGRLGFISSSTFFRTGSGENLRTFLSDGVAVESVVDFGDLQLFEGVTTYPAILTLRKDDGNGQGKSQTGNLSFLNVTGDIPDDLERVFIAGMQPMFLSRLTTGAWRFEPEEIARLRDKIAAGRKTLGEVYGPPLRGIVTGLNEAFVVDRATRDRLVKADPRSAELLKPFLRGEDVKRWRVESEDLFLINTPKGKVDIAAYPAVEKWLLPFRPELEKRATQQEWWELQQAQLAYQERFEGTKIVYQDITAASPFTLDGHGYFLANTCYFIADDSPAILALLNSRLAWSFFQSVTNIARGGYLRLRTEFVEQLPIPDMSPAQCTALAALGQTCTEAARARFATQSAVRHRFLDLAPPERAKLTTKLENWHELDFAAFQAEIKKGLPRRYPPEKTRRMGKLPQ
jgi:N-6 DNA Methylase/TaqI-like C-terminal specificity domain